MINWGFDRRGLRWKLNLALLPALTVSVLMLAWRFRVREIDPTAAAKRAPARAQIRVCFQTHGRLKSHAGRESGETSHNHRDHPKGRAGTAFA